MYFLRAIGFSHLHFKIKQLYQLPEGCSGLPESVFYQPMTLIPANEVNIWYQSMEESTKDPDFLLKATQEKRLDMALPAHRWFFSGADLASTVRRINYGFSSVQSGCSMVGAQVGPILKWIYRNPQIQTEVKVHDGIRMATFMLQVLREYLGENFAPMRVHLPGKRDNRSLYGDYFGCEVEWNQPRVEIWFHASHRLATQMQHRPKAKSLAMSYQELDDFLNMPDPTDELKVLYETINYACHYGYPSLERVSALLGLSTQQCQRRLHVLGMSYSIVLGYVLSNIAVNLLSRKVPIENVAHRLGYQHVASFNRMFKKQRGVTPSQYCQRFEV